MNDEDLLNSLKEKAQTISPLYVEAWLSIIQERIEATAASGGSQCNAKEFGVLCCRWEEASEGEMSVLDFIRRANRTPTIFFSAKSRIDRTLCYMAYSRDGKSDCLISNADYNAIAYPVRQQLDECLIEISVAIFHEVARRLAQAGYTLSFVRNPEADPRIGIAQEHEENQDELDEDDYDGEYEMYIRISWEQRPPVKRQTHASASGDRSFWYRIIGE